MNIRPQRLFLHAAHVSVNITDHPYFESIADDSDQAEQSEAKTEMTIDKSTRSDTPSADKEKPRGVVRMETIAALMSFSWWCCLYAGLFLVSYTDSLNSLVTGTYQS